MSALKVCPTCGAEYPANERFCPKDGDLLGSSVVTARAPTRPDTVWPAADRPAAPTSVASVPVEGAVLVSFMSKLRAIRALDEADQSKLAPMLANCP